MSFVEWRYRKQYGDILTGDNHPWMEVEKKVCADFESGIHQLAANLRKASFRMLQEFQRRNSVELNFNYLAFKLIKVNRTPSPYLSESEKTALGLLVETITAKIGWGLKAENFPGEQPYENSYQGLIKGLADVADTMMMAQAQREFKKAVRKHYKAYERVVQEEYQDQAIVRLCVGIKVAAIHEYLNWWTHPYLMGRWVLELYDRFSNGGKCPF